MHTIDIKSFSNCILLFSNLTNISNVINNKIGNVIEINLTLIKIKFLVYLNRPGILIDFTS
jgi:hypothetical protein